MPSDPQQSLTLELLQQNAGGLSVSSFALIELFFVMRSQGKNDSQISEVMQILEKIIQNYQIRIDPCEPEMFIVGLRIHSKHSQRKTFFDALLAASSVLGDKIIISDDSYFSKVPDLEQLSLREAVKQDF